MTYVLENKNESKRLEKQNAQPQYLIEKELEFLKLNLQNKKILDAGCGAGTLTRILARTLACQPHSQIDACDFSELRVKEAQKKSKDDNIHYFVANLTKMDIPNNQYDVIFTRFVLEHTKRPNDIVKELIRVLKPGGHLAVIDLDGLIFGIHHENPILTNYLNKLQEHLPIDLYIERKLPRMLSEMNLIISEFYVQPLIFEGQDLEDEIVNMKMRFSQTQNLIQEILGKENFDNFLDLYISEMRKSEIMVFYKYIVIAQKRSEIVPPLRYLNNNPSVRS